MVEKIQFTLNNKPVSLEVDGDRKLLWVLRTDLAITGVKCGCGEGLCGTCTVLINGEAVPSCQVRMRDVHGVEVTTIEGLEKDGVLHPLQKAFHEHGAFQCGFCTPGMLMSAKALLDSNPDPSRDEIRLYMSGNLCRCGSYEEVIEAIQAVAAGEY